MFKLAKPLTAAALALAAMAGAAIAEYPEKPVEFVVPWPPGDLEDVLTRMIAEDFQAAYGVPAAVVNKPGGGGGHSLARSKSRMRLLTATRLGPSSSRSPSLARRSAFQS